MTPEERAMDAAFTALATGKKVVIDDPDGKAFEAGKTIFGTMKVTTANLPKAIRG